jgi:hypothetical protein
MILSASQVMKRLPERSKAEAKHRESLRINELRSEESLSLVTWLDNGLGLLETVSGVIVPEI